MNISVLSAVFRRNFVSYFANPTGYLFICVFMILSSIAAFWPSEFFNVNLANLDQLNSWFFWIMAVFVPTITMGIWADERRQGTDELLLTIPASDFDVVLGKYLAAVAIFTVSLLFSLACNFGVMKLLLGNPDPGLFLGTYLGYWIVGLAMLAIGMVGSFLTSNITIAFVFGVLLNAPLVLVGASGVSTLVSLLAAIARGFFSGLPALAQTVRTWSLQAAFDDFSHGVLSLSTIVYLLMIVAVMLYVSMILIGRRHWRSGWQQQGMALHYVLRVVSLMVVAAGLNVLLHRVEGKYHLRFDITSEHINSLAPQTKDLLANLKLDRPVEIEAFLSPSVPEAYVQTRLNILSVLRELQARGGPKNIHLQIYDTERFSKEALLAERPPYRITSRRVETMEQGAREAENIYLGVAMKYGSQRVVVPFIDKGIPVEYELVRSLCTVVKQKRGRIGVLNTDAQLYGRFNFQSMAPSASWPIVDELQKQYEVVQVDATKPITEKYDVLLAVQPSTLGPEDLENFLAAVRSGQPTAIFEDPCPALVGEITPTSMPRQPPGGMNPMMMPRTLPKGEIGRLWQMLGVDFPADQVVWQKYNPYKKVRPFPEEFVFVDRGESGKINPFGPDIATPGKDLETKPDPAADDPISAGLQQVLLPFPGWIRKLNASDLTFVPLLRTGENTGTVPFAEIMQGERGGSMLHRTPANKSFVLAAHIRGKARPDQLMAGDDAPPTPADAVEIKPAGQTKPAAKAPAGTPAADLNVVLVADVDMISPAFFQLREQGDIPELGIRFDFDNVSFVLNVLDELAGNGDFVAIRGHRPKHRTLTQIESWTESSRRDAATKREEYYKKCDDEEKKEQAALDKKLAEMQKRTDGNTQEMIYEIGVVTKEGQQRLETKREQLRQQRDADVTKIETNLKNEVSLVQNTVKLLAVALPPILPFLLGLTIFIIRRSGEREGVSRSRLR